MKNAFLDKDDIRQVFVACDFIDPDGLYANDVDIFEFADKLIQVASFKVARAEREKCIEFVESLNTEVAKALKEKRGQL